MFLNRHRKYGGAPKGWQGGAEEEMAGASAQRRDPLLLLYDRYLHDHNDVSNVLNVKVALQETGRKKRDIP